MKHVFKAVTLPSEPGSQGGVGTLAYLFPKDAHGFECAKCGLVVGVLTPKLEDARLVYVGVGSFPNTPEWWGLPHWQCSEEFGGGSNA